MSQKKCHTVACNAMSRMQRISCLSVPEPVISLSPLAENFSSLSLLTSLKRTSQNVRWKASYLQCSQNVARPNRNIDRGCRDKRQTNDTTNRFFARRRQSVRFALQSSPQPVLYRKDCLSNSKCQYRADAANCWPCACAESILELPSGDRNWLVTVRPDPCSKDSGYDMQIPSFFTKMHSDKQGINQKHPCFG